MQFEGNAYVDDDVDGFDYELNWQGSVEQICDVSTIGPILTVGKKYIQSVTTDLFNANHVYTSNGVGGWDEEHPAIGWGVCNEALNRIIIYTTTGWIPLEEQCKNWNNMRT